MNRFFTTSVVFCSLLLVGCSKNPEEIAKIEEMTKNPKITLVGEFDGCIVKYVNRYYRDISFYLAKCNNTTTTTRTFDEKLGKTTIKRTRAEITQQIEELKAEANTIEAEEKVLPKLTQEEKTILGIK